MAIKTNIGGVWKDATPYVNVNGVFKPVQNAWVNVGGAWKLCYQAKATIILTFNGGGSIEVKANGTLVATASGTYDVPGGATITINAGPYDGYISISELGVVINNQATHTSANYSFAATLSAYHIFAEGFSDY